MCKCNHTYNENNTPVLMASYLRGIKNNAIISISEDTMKCDLCGNIFKDEDVDEEFYNIVLKRYIIQLYYDYLTSSVVEYLIYTNIQNELDISNPMSMIKLLTLSSIYNEYNDLCHNEMVLHDYITNTETNDHFKYIIENINIFAVNNNLI